MTKFPEKHYTLWQTRGNLNVNAGCDIQDDISIYTFFFRNQNVPHHYCYRILMMNKTIPSVLLSLNRKVLQLPLMFQPSTSCELDYKTTQAYFNSCFQLLLVGYFYIHDFQDQNFLFPLSFLWIHFRIFPITKCKFMVNAAQQLSFCNPKLIFLQVVTEGERTQYSLAFNCNQGHEEGWTVSNKVYGKCSLPFQKLAFN